MSVLHSFAPQRVLYYFEELCKIPHGSGDTKKISDYCVSVANNLGLWVRQDQFNNVIIKKPASAGYEHHPAVILQGHLDMVCEKDPDCDLDFAKDGLRLSTDGEWIFAKGTTLGGDDGIAVAMALAVLEDDSLAHPPIEAVFTTDEETGMYGAQGIDVSDLEGTILLNIDSECEGVLTVSCAGGARAELTVPLTQTENALPCKKVSFRGLRGGHSGVEIDKGRINADILMGEFLNRLPLPYALVSLEGGTKDNAIPAHSQCILATSEDMTAFAESFAAEHRPETDGGLVIEITDANPSNLCFDETSTRRAAEFLTSLPNGIQSMSKDIEGLVQTSLNLGQLRTDSQTLTATFSVRSSVEEEKKALLQQLNRITLSFGGTFDARGDYPAWEYKQDSVLRDTMTRIYQERYGTSPVVEAIHAGLECGFFCQKIPGLDAVSFGPDMRDIHTPREKLSIPSVKRTYEYLCHILKEL
ncbi:MAG: aminoacyl-histidine dipeptidase [Clostridia bacterium]|nr:aminoacyl-histidine dipeptidase [Clostridia bacterium]